MAKVSVDGEDKNARSGGGGVERGGAGGGKGGGRGGRGEVTEKDNQTEKRMQRQRTLVATWTKELKAKQREKKP